MLRNTWESQNARAATLQDAAFELEQELGTVRVQYAAAVASLQVSLLRTCSTACFSAFTTLPAKQSPLARIVTLSVGLV